MSKGISAADKYAEGPRSRCDCHGEEMAWHKDSRKQTGGFWSCLVRQTEHKRRWNKANPERKREIERRWRDANPERAREHTRRYYSTPKGFRTQQRKVQKKRSQRITQRMEEHAEV